MPFGGKGTWPHLEPEPTLSRTVMACRGRELPCPHHRCRCRPPRHRSAGFSSTTVLEACLASDAISLVKPLRSRSIIVPTMGISLPSSRLYSTSTTSPSLINSCSTSSFVRSVSSISSARSRVVRGTRPASSLNFSPSIDPVQWDGMCVRWNGKLHSCGVTLNLVWCATL